MNKTMTCIECPNGCLISVTFDCGEIKNITGNKCPRGEIYARGELLCPRRVLTSTVKTNEGVLPVKSDKPVKKSELFAVMEKINKVRVKIPVKIGDVIIANVSENINIVATDNK